MNEILVYHGGTNVVEHPLCRFGRDNLDFGQGFYVTDLRQQAVGWARKEIIMSNHIGSISMELAKRLDITPLRALKLFYESKACADLHDKRTGLYLYSDRYIADEYMLEMQGKQ